MTKQYGAVYATAQYCITPAPGSSYSAIKSYIARRYLREFPGWKPRPQGNSKTWTNNIMFSDYSVGSKSSKLWVDNSAHSNNWYVLKAMILWVQMPIASKGQVPSQRRKKGLHPCARDLRSKDRQIFFHSSSREFWAETTAPFSVSVNYEKVLLSVWY